MTVQTTPARQPATLEDVAGAIGDLTILLSWVGKALGEQLIRSATSGDKTGRQITNLSETTKCVEEAQKIVKRIGNAVARLASDEEAPAI